jgi:hypothetical protein
MSIIPTITMKKLQKEGLFSMADKFITDFFGRLENGTAKNIIDRAENAKLSKEAIKLMKDIDDNSERLKKIVKDLSK